MPKTRAGSGQVKTNLQFQGSSGIVIPVGTTAERNPTPQSGEIRFNTDINAFEGYTGTVWGSMGPYPFFNVEYFTGDGTTSEFDLGFSATNADLVIVTLNGVTLTAGRDFDLSYPDRIRFIELDGSTVNPPSENAEITVRYFSPVTSASIPAGIITAQELAVTGTAGQILSLDINGELEWISIPTQTPALGGSYLEGTTDQAEIKANSISIRELAVSDGQLGQVLATDGAGNLTFITTPSSFNSITVSTLLRMTAQAVAPLNPLAGTIAVADGASWDPAAKAGSVPYPVFYDGVAWHAFY
jgi:hypothetical protein